MWSSWMTPPCCKLQGIARCLPRGLSVFMCLWHRDEVRRRVVCSSAQWIELACGIRLFIQENKRISTFWQEDQPDPGLLRKEKLSSFAFLCILKKSDFYCEGDLCCVAFWKAQNVHRHDLSRSLSCTFWCRLFVFSGLDCAEASVVLYFAALCGTCEICVSDSLARAAMPHPRWRERRLLLVTAGGQAELTNASLSFLSVRLSCREAPWARMSLTVSARPWRSWRTSISDCSISPEMVIFW